MCTPNMVFDNYNAGYTSIRYFMENLSAEEKANLTIVSPDAGGMARAKAFH
jgi:phosphoribosylpyrophosphate synthetase